MLFFFKQKTAYEMRISDWSSDVCSSDLPSRFMARPCFKIEKAFPEPLAGVDEAGCAPLAGPVVAAAVILDRKRFPRGIDDSKALPAPAREAICAILSNHAPTGYGLASVEATDHPTPHSARQRATPPPVH